MYRWLTLGELPEEMKEPTTYALVALFWFNIALLVWAFSPWFPWK